MKLFKADSIDSLITRVEGKDLEMAIEIYKNVARGYKRKYKKVSVFDVALPNGDVMSFEIEKHEWPKALTTCIEVLAENDMFEECIEAKKILDELAK